MTDKEIIEGLRKENEELKRLLQVGSRRYYENQALKKKVEAYEKGIDNVLFQLSNEDINDVHVVEAIADDLRKVYAGDKPKYLTPVYRSEGK